MSSQSDISNTVNDTYDSTQNVANLARKDAGNLKDQGMKTIKNMTSQASQSMDEMNDAASEMKKSVLNYVSEKPGKSIAIALGALYLWRKLTR